MLSNYYSYSPSHVSIPYSYRYGFNGKENDKEVSGQQDYGMRIYDSRLGRFKSVDPYIYKFAMLSSYQYSGNRPIDCIDLDGLESAKIIHYSDYNIQLIPAGDNLNFIKMDNDVAKQRMFDENEVKRLIQNSTQSSAVIKQGGVMSTPEGYVTVTMQSWALKYGVPGFDLATRWARGEKISTLDIGLEAFASLPVGKVSKIPGIEKLLKEGVEFGGEFILRNYTNIRPWLRYQAQITKSAIGMTYKYGGKEFDGFVDGVLIEAKGVGNLKWMKQDGSKLKTMLKQADDQVKAANGTPLEWHFAEQGAKEMFDEALPANLKDK